MPQMLMLLIKLIGLKKVQLPMLKIKDNVVHVGHLVQLVFWKVSSLQPQENYQIYQNNN